MVNGLKMMTGPWPAILGHEGKMMLALSLCADQ